MIEPIKKNKCGKLTDEQIVRIWTEQDAQCGYVPYHLAELFGVSKQTIYRWCRIEHVREYQRNWCRKRGAVRDLFWVDRKPLDCIECQNKMSRRDVRIERDSTDYYVVKCPHCGRRTQRFATPNLAIWMWNADTIDYLRERLKAKNGK